MTVDISLDELFDSPIDAVWRSVTHAPTLARWLMENDFEPRPGHKFTLRDPATATWRGWIECEVVELDPPRRMVWSWDGGAVGERPSRVTIELRSEGEGTRLTLRHEGKAIAQCEPMRAGWARKLAALRAALTPGYAQDVHFRAPRERVFDAIATLDGLRGWWTTRVSGSAARDGDIRFEFEGLDEHIVMRVDAATSPSSVRWRCVEHTDLDEWAGTTLTFDITARTATTCDLSFRHAGLVPTLACYEDCEAGWEHFLGSLLAYVEKGKGAPFGA